MAQQKDCLLYGISTCIHCRHTIEFLKEKGVKFDIIFVDQTQGEEREEVLEKVAQYNPNLSFPTVVIDGGKEVVVGFSPEALTKALSL